MSDSVCMGLGGVETHYWTYALLADPTRISPLGGSPYVHVRVCRQCDRIEMRSAGEWIDAGE